MKKLDGFINIRKHISARIFVYFSTAMLSIVFVLTGLWYLVNINTSFKTVSDAVSAVVVNAGKQIDNDIADIMNMRVSQINDKNVNMYILDEIQTPPTLSWFNQYERVLSLLNNFVATYPRTISGSGVYKLTNERCFSGGITPIPFENTNQIPDKDTLIIYSNHLYLARKISYHGYPKAYLLTQFVSGFFQDNFEQGLHAGYNFLVTNEAGQIMYDSLNDQDNEIYSAVPVIMEKRLKTYSTNQYFYTAYISEITGLTTVCSVPMNLMRGNMNYLSLQFASVLLLSITVTAFISRMLSNRITRGIHTLSKNIELVCEGCYDSLNTVETEDEIGELSRMFSDMVMQNNRLGLEMKEKEKQKHIMEIQVLRAQVSPHFLYNSLNNITRLAAMQNVKNIQNLSSALIKLLQAAVKIDDALIPLYEEIEYAKNYYEILKYSHAHDISFETDIQTGIYGCMSMRMILQPIIENAIIHGLSGVRGGGAIRLRAFVSMNALVLTVTDNGIGMNAEDIEQALNKKSNDSSLRFTGIGLGNINKRIKLQFGEEYGLSIYSQPKLFTTVEARLPYIPCDTKPGAAHSEVQNEKDTDS